MKPTFVYPYMEQLAQGQELRWSLRSLQKFCQFDFNVVIVGDRPKWYKGDHIPTDKVRGIPYAKAHDITAKLLAIIDSPLVPDNFIYTYDDVYNVAPVNIEDYSKVIAIDYLNKNVRPTRFGGSQKWMKMLNDTRNALQMDDVYSYETHLPRTFNKELLLKIITSYRIDIKPMLVSTLYFNEYYDKPDVVLVNSNEYKASIYERLSYPQILHKCVGKKWLNHSENAFNDGMQTFLAKSFPEKCNFEL